MNHPSSPSGGLFGAIVKLRADALARRRRQLEVASLPRIGGMASIPSRADTLGKVVARIVPQVERLYLFLHGYDAIPDSVRHSRVIPVLAPKDTPWRTSGRFYGLSVERGPCLYFCFDDDIAYPPDYVARLAKALVRHEGNAIVGFHAHNFLPPYESYIRDRSGVAFDKRKLFESEVDELGSGTLGFVSSRLSFDPMRWKYGDMDDIMIAQEAERAGLKRIALARGRRYIRRVPGEQVESLYKRTTADEGPAVEQLRELVQLMGRKLAEAAPAPAGGKA